MIKNVFTTTEAIKLSGLNRRKLDTLIMNDIIKPAGKLDGKSNYYTWNQILELKLIAKLRKLAVKIPTIKQAQTQLEKCGYDDSYLSNKAILVTDKQIAIIDENSDKIGTIITGNMMGQRVLAKILWADLRSELYEAGRNNIVNFEKRLDSLGVSSHRITKFKPKEKVA